MQNAADTYANRCAAMIAAWQQIQPVLLRTPGVQAIGALLRRAGFDCSEFLDLYGEALIRDGIRHCNDLKSKTHAFPAARRHGTAGRIRNANRTIRNGGSYALRAGNRPGNERVKAALYDENCRKVCDAGKEYPLSCPQNGWAEQNAEDWYRAAAACIRQAIAQSGVRPQDIVSVGAQRPNDGIVLLDKNGAPLRPAILWCDQRGAQECEEINARVGTQNIFDITCNRH